MLETYAMITSLKSYSLYEFGCSIDYDGYQARLYDSYKRLHHIFGHTAASYLRYLIESRPELLIAEVKDGIVYTHKWRNGEIKSLLSPFTPFSKEDHYWASHYSFIKQCPAINCNRGISIETYDVRIDSLRHIHDVQVPDGCNATLISHVNHYGHFVLDSLPLHHALHGYFGMSNIYGLNPGLNKAIVNEFNSMMQHISPEHFAGSSSTMPSAFRISRAIAAYTSSPLVSIFLLSHVRDTFAAGTDLSPAFRTLREKMPTVFAANRRRLFVTRGGHAASRISNYYEVTRILIANGFCPIDIGNCTIEEMVILFKNADTIVSECGTASHLSAFFSSDDTKIYSLVPKRLLHEAAKGSLFGCLSYYCGYLHKLNFIVGDSVENCASPTSDSTYYNSNYINKLLGSDRPRSRD
jgi:hypothetical protein